LWNIIPAAAGKVIAAIMLFVVIHFCKKKKNEEVGSLGKDARDKQSKGTNAVLVDRNS
jgi:hypothetical protein